MSIVAERMDVPVEGGTLRALRFGAGPNLAVGVHGITGSGMAWQAVARHLPEDWTLVAPDLCGRGHSGDLGPYGLRRHAEDVARVVERFPAGTAVVAGHSMGAYVALLATAQHPDRLHRLLLIDGGLPLPVPDGADTDQMLAAILGPALTRLQQTFASERAYLDFWRDHPALTDAWNADVEAYVRYDLTGPPGAMRSRVAEPAVRQDGRDLLTGGLRFERAFQALTAPALLLTAPRGMLGQPPGLIREPMVAHWQRQLPRLRTELIDDANHYTILLEPKAAATVAQRIADVATWPDAAL
jgi:lipase